MSDFEGRCGPSVHWRSFTRDARRRFREIFCRVLEKRGPALPDYRLCDEALTRVGVEPEGTGKEVDSLSSSAGNARQIRDAILQMQLHDAETRLVLIGYSKGAPDILEAVFSYPEIHSRVAAVVSASGAVGGSPLAYEAEQSQLSLFRNWPGAQCSPGDGGAIESLRPSTRKTWLARNPLPHGFPYYSLVTFPQPERISAVLKLGYNKLSRVDARNDGQILFYDQVIPGSALVGYINADHCALAVPVARAHPMLGTTFVDHNQYPREALLEALLRFVEEDLTTSEKWLPRFLCRHSANATPTMPVGS